MSLSPTHQPTNHQPPTDYISIRLTVPHDEWARIHRSILHDTDDYVAYPHSGKTNENPHWHIFIGASNLRDAERYRKRVKTEFGSGNAVFSLKFLHNGVLSAVQYGSREKTKPMVSGAGSEWVSSAPSWVSRSELVSKPSKERLGDPTLTLSNLLRQSVKFAREHMPESRSLQNVLSRMVNQHNWVPSRELIRNGVPRDFHLMFIHRMQNTSQEYQWMRPHVPTEDQLRWRERPDDTPLIVPDPGASVAPSEPVVEYCSGHGSGLFKHKSFNK